MRRLTLATLPCLAATAPTATAAPGLRAEKHRSQEVLAQVPAINRHLDVVMQQWDGARVRLSSLQDSLRANERVLRISRANLNSADNQLEQRLYDLYIDPNPGAVDVFAGATSIDDLITRLSATHDLAAQDLAIAKQALHLHRTVAHREALLRSDRRQVVGAIAKLNAQRATISDALVREQRLLATIHESIRRLTEDAAAAQRRRAEVEREQIARRVEAARTRAASEAITSVQNPALAPAEPVSPATTTSAASSSLTASPPTPTPTVTPPAPGGGHPDAAAIAAATSACPTSGAERARRASIAPVSLHTCTRSSESHFRTTPSRNGTPPSRSLLLISQRGPFFFDGLGHVGIYIGGSQFIHAPHPGTVVQVGTLSGYWAANLDGARRVP